MEFGVLAVEVVLQTVEIASTFPFTHGEVVEQVVATGLWLGGWHLGLGENPLKALDGELAHIVDGVGACHDDIHACETAHRTYIDHIVLDARVAKPCCHEVLHAVHSRWGNGRLLVGLRDAQVEGGEAFVFTRNVNAWLEVGMVDGEALYNLHITLC